MKIEILRIICLIPHPLSFIFIYKRNFSFVNINLIFVYYQLRLTVEAYCNTPLHTSLIAFRCKGEKFFALTFYNSQFIVNRLARNISATFLALEMQPREMNGGFPS